MKQFLTKFLIVVLMITLALALVSCKKKGDSESESTATPPASESVQASDSSSTPAQSTPAESTPAESTPVESTHGSVTGAGTPVDGVDVSPALDLLSPILGNEYVTIEFAFEYSNKDGSYLDDLGCEVTAHVKQTAKGYDAVANVVVSEQYVSGSGDYSYNHTAVIDVYYIDGLLVMAGKMDEGEVEYVKGELGTLSDLVTMVNGQIANNPEMLEAYQMAMPAFEELLAVIDQVDLRGLAVNETIDVKQLVFDVVDYVEANKAVDMYSWILRDVLGINPSDTAAVTALENEILALGEGNPTVAQVLDRLVALVNKKANTQIVLKDIVDAIQAELGMTTAEIIDMYNEEVMGYWKWDENLQEDVWCTDDYLPAPGEGDTVYDYFYALLNMYKLNDLLAEGDFDSFEDFCSFIKGGLQYTTFGDFVNEILRQSFTRYDREYVGDGNGDHAWVTEEHPYYVGEGEGNYVWNEEYGYYEYVGYGYGDYVVNYSEYFKYVGEGNGDYVETEIDYVSQMGIVKQMLGEFDVNLVVNFDANGRPVSADASFAITVLTGEATTATQECAVEISFSYTRPSVSFEIPAEALENAEDMFGGSSGKVEVA